MTKAILLIIIILVALGVIGYRYRHKASEQDESDLNPRVSEIEAPGWSELVSLLSNVELSSRQRTDSNNRLSVAKGSESSVPTFGRGVNPQDRTDNPVR